MNDILGRTVTDGITGFTGVAIGHVRYLTGCNQTLVQPAGKDATVRPNAEWFDDQRLSVIDVVPPVVLDNSATPGCDRAAPHR